MHRSMSNELPANITGADRLNPIMASATTLERIPIMQIHPVPTERTLESIRGAMMLTTPFRPKRSAIQRAMTWYPRECGLSVMYR